MQTAQESLAELRAAIRYCENAISAAESTIESMDFRQQLANQQAMNKQESTGREVALTKTVKELEATNDTLVVDNHNLERENAKLREDKERLTALEVQLRDKIRELKEGKATMPVIPRDVAIAIFREGVHSGVADACSMLAGVEIDIEEDDQCGDFSVSFSRRIDLRDELDLDWMRDKVGQCNEEFVADALKGLCKKENFECRIHGIDDND
jgi:regulator of replication initiation timing